MSSGQFDADTPEGAKGYSSQYMQKKDVVRIGLSLVVLAVVMFPVYKLMEENGKRTACKRNIRGMWSAMQQYSETYDMRYPPLYEVGYDNGSPSMNDGKPATWASSVSGFLPTGSNMTCPSSESGEHTHVQGHIVDERSSRKEKVTQDIALTYGMYAALETRPSSDVLQPSNTVLITETANHGARDSYNPVPFEDDSGSILKQDGFLIGWNDSNFSISDESVSVSRLAFYGVKNGDFAATGVSARHKEYIYGVHVDGTLTKLYPSDARLQKSGGRITKNWLTE